MHGMDGRSLRVSSRGSGARISSAGLYMAYTFIAVPAAVFGTGAAGFFAVPCTIIVYPFVFVVMPRL